MQNRPAFRRHNTNGGNSFIPKALAGQPLKKVNSEPVSAKTRERLDSFAHKTAGTNRDTTLSHRSNSNPKLASTETKQNVTRKAIPKEPPLVALDPQLPRSHKENSKPIPQISAHDQPVLHAEQTPVPKRAAKANPVAPEPMLSSSQGSKDIPCTPQPRFALNDLLNQTNTTPSVAASSEETSPEERVSWRNTPKRAEGQHSQATPLARLKNRASKPTKRARSSSPIDSPRASKRTSTQHAFDISSSTKTPLSNPFEDAWTRRVEDSGIGNPLLKSVNRFDGSSPRASGVGDSPSAFRRSFSCPAKKLKLVDSPSDGLGRVVDKKHLSALKQAIKGAVGPNPNNDRVSSLLAKIQEDAKIAATKKAESPSASLNSSYLARYDDVSSSIQEQITPPVVETGPWSNPSSAIVSKRPGLGAVAGESKVAQKDAQNADLDEYGLDDDDDEEMFELFESTSRAAQLANSVQEAPILGKHASKQRDYDATDYGLDDLDEDDSWEIDVAAAVGNKQASGKPNKNSGDLPSAKRKPAATPIPSDDYGSDFDPDEVVKDARSGIIQRFLVLDVFEDDYTSSNGSTQQEKSLRVEDERTRTERRVLLRQAWMDCDVREGDVVNVIGNFDDTLTCIVDNKKNMLILHPDILLSATAVADSFDCLRLAALKERVKAISEASQWSVYGNILHELFQTALSANNFTSQFLEKEISRILSSQLQNLYAVRITPNMATDHLRTKLPPVQEWAKRFVSAQPKKGAVIVGHRAPDTGMAIRKVLDVEEHIWSPKYGLKGNMDVSVEVGIEDAQGRSTLTVPLELKTGKNTRLSHRAQTMLYTLLMSDRYDIDSLCGILYYLDTSETIRIPSLVDELRGLMIGRNHLASFVYRKHDLPPMLQDKRTCGKCYAKTSCFVYHKAMENGTDETSGVGDIFNKETAHITPVHSEFFNKWESLLSKEEKDMERFRKELWVMSSDEREAVGRCFSDLSMIPESAPTSNDHVSKINRFHYRFVKRAPSSSFSFLESQIGVGEPIVISDEDGHFALAKGYTTKISSQWIMVAVDRRLHNSRVRKPGFHETKNQSFSAIMEVLEDGTTKPTSPVSSQEAQTSYRIDKDEFSNGMALIRNNLIELIKADANPRQRELIVELAPPVYNIASTEYPLPSASQGKLNIDQKNAIEKVMSAQDYALVLGMPGTGKTTTIAHIIRALVHQGKSVLLTSYTHTAVDNILLKIKDDPIKVLRLGVTSKIHPEVQNFAVLANASKKSFEEIQDSFQSPQVVATTCLSINHVVFTERVFDYCIVDEASQITLPVCIGPIRMAKKFVLVGDHFQLPPLVRSQEAKAGGLDVSLFKLLSDTHPDSVVNLEHQYRMCEEIMTLSNHLIYEGRLKCGTDKVARSSLHIPNIDALESFHKTPQVPGTQGICGSGSTPCWIKDLFKENVKARFLNTDAVSAPEERKGDRIYNPVEAELTRQLVEGFLHCGVDAKEIGVVSVYRSQIKAIQHLLHGHPSVEMHTADKFQGRDKDCIIISLVRSNDKENVGELLKDWRRINVAFTRAKTKLLIIGSKSTLKTNDLLGKFVDMMEEREWIYNLPSNAHLLHNIPIQYTQTGRSPVKTNSQPHCLDIENRQPVQKSILDMLGKKPGTNGVAKAVPKTGTMNQRSLLGSRPILRNIMNEING
ncbi:hypothetical protein ABW19_dt0210524 [Dactylella cylindrospora]|nr:hypothetical protein ABW19_dt0210524 [Dactylella cylindrospora]